MTSNERKIIKCLWEAKGRTRVQALAQSAGFSSDYTRLLCRSLARGGYLKFADANACYLLTRGRNLFQDNGPADEKSIAIQNEILEEKVRKMQSKMKLDNRKMKAKKRKKKSSQRQANLKKKLKSKNLLQIKIKKKKARTKQEEKPKKNALENLQDASAGEKEKLADAGYKKVEDLAQYSVSRFIQDIGMSLKKAANWINQVRRKSGAIHDEKVESRK